MILLSNFSPIKNNFDVIEKPLFHKQWLFILLQNYHPIIETNSMKKGG